MPTPTDRFSRVWKETELNREKFGKTIGVSGPTVSLIANGDREFTLDVARKVSARYGYRVGWLLEGEEPEKPDTSRVAERLQARANGARDALAAIRRLADEIEATMATAAALGASARAGKARAAGQLPTTRDAKREVQKPSPRSREDPDQEARG